MDKRKIPIEERPVIMPQKDGDNCPNSFWYV